MKGVSGEKAASYYELVPDRPFNDIRYNISMNKLVELGWQSRVSWEEGINRTSTFSLLAMYIFFQSKYAAYACNH